MDRNPARNGNDRRASNLLPDLEDVGKLLNDCSSDQGSKSNQGQSSDGKDCSTCHRKDTCETTVHASSKLTGHENPVSEEVMLNTKDQIPSKQGPQASFAKAAHQATEGHSTKVAENAAQQTEY